jgi:hypothetical protein
MVAALFAAGLVVADGPRRGSAAFAGPGDSGLTVESRRPIFSNDGRTYPPHNELHFPFLHEAPDGTWYMTHREGPHGGGIRTFGIDWDDPRANLTADDRVQTVMSTDRGRTWLPWPGLKADSRNLRLFRTRLEDGTWISHRYRVDDLAPDGGKTRGRVIILRSSDDGASWTRRTADVTGLPYGSRVGIWGHIVAPESGRLLATVYGPQAGQRYGLGLLESGDQGATWRFIAELAGPDTPGNEGPNEADLVHLGGGELLVVFRTGTREPSELHEVRSQDGGKTWTKPRSLGVAAAVSPQLLRLDSGVLVNTYGTRAGERRVWARVSYDGGRRWQQPLLLYDGPGSGYTDVQSLGEDRFHVVFDQSPFGGSTKAVEQNAIIRIVLRAAAPPGR